MKLFYKGAIVFLFCFITLAGCVSYKNTLKNDTEKILIKIYGWTDDGFVEDFSIHEITAKEEIEKVINYVTNIISPAYKCAYQGKIEYYCKNNNLIMDMEFNTSCNTIVFIYNDKLYTRRLSKSGINYLSGLVD